MDVDQDLLGENECFDEEKLLKLSEEAKENSKKKAKEDWLEFTCDVIDVEPFISVTEFNNYDGTFYSAARCKGDARKMFRAIYDDISQIVSKNRLYEAALKEIVDFVKECFETVQMKYQDHHARDEGIIFDNYFDLEKFRNEVSEKLKSVRPGKLRGFHHYFSMVEYDYANGEMDGLSEVIGKMLIAWNYNGYDAYMALEKDAHDIALKYSKQATLIARTALRKRIEWLEELKKTAA